MEGVSGGGHVMDARLLTVSKAVIVQVVDVCHVDRVLKHTCAGQQHHQHQQRVSDTNTGKQQALLSALRSTTVCLTRTGHILHMHIQHMAWADKGKARADSADSGRKANKGML